MAAGSVFSQLAVRGGGRWTPQRIAWMGMVMAWQETPQLGERFHAARSFLKRCRPHWQLGTSYDGWVQAQHRETPRVMPHILGRLRREMDMRRKPDPAFPRWQVFAVDGTTVACPRTQANQQAMGEKGQPDGTPLVALTALFDLQLALPWAFRVGPGQESEQAHLKQMLAELPERSLLVADAGFQGYGLYEQMMQRGQPFLLRVGGNVTLLTELGYAYEVQGQTVYLWPDAEQRKGRPPLSLRLIRLEEAPKQPVYLVTNVQDPQLLSDAEAAAIYRRRWQEEVFYRTVKQTFAFHQLRSRTPENCYQELSWALLGIWLLGLQTVDQLQSSGEEAKSWSPAASRNVVRRVVRGDRPDPLSRRSLTHIWSRCTKDRYARHSPKASRNYPRKKRHKPPKPPNIKMATATQRQQAQTVTPMILAA